MKPFRLFRVELGRLFRNRTALLVFALTALSPAVWLLLRSLMGAALTDDYATTMNSLYIATPAMTGGIAGAVLFALLTVRQLDAPHKFRVSAITDAMVPPLTQALVRLLALLSAAVVVQVAATVLWLPYTAYRVGAVFDLSVYLRAYGILMLPSVLMAVLFSAAVYQFTRRTDLSLMAFLAFAALSLTVWSQDWQLCWLNPVLFALSDDFSNDRLFRTVGYARLTWLLALSGLYALAHLCVRQYGKGLAGSFLQSVRRVYRPTVALLLLISAGAAFVCQPFYDHSSPDLSQSILDTRVNINFRSCELYVDVVPDPATGSLYGRAVYRMERPKDIRQTLELIVTPGYALSARINGNETECTWTGVQINNGEVVEIILPAVAEIELELTYGGFPRAWNLTTYDPGKPEISDTYMRLENWMLYPWMRNAPMPFSTVMDVMLPEGMLPVLFRPEKEELLSANGDGTSTWRMNFWGGAAIFYAGDYVRKDIRAADLTISLYYGRKHEAIMEAAGVEDAVRRTVEYCTAHYGPLDFYAGGALKLVMARTSGGGYAGNGASLMDEGDFTAENLLDAGKGAGAGSGAVMIHELVHQWWGLGNMFEWSDGTSPWSAEGLTVYTTYRIMKELYGAEYARMYYVDQWQREAEDYFQNFYVRNPEYLSTLPEAYQYNIANSLATVRRYSEMPLKILKAEELVGGEAAMDRILYGLFNREPDTADPYFPYLSYQAFLNACGLTEEELDLG